MWNKKHKQCRECKTTERKHKGLGLCDRCYANYRYGKFRDRISNQRSRRLADLRADNPGEYESRLEAKRKQSNEYYERMKRDAGLCAKLRKRQKIHRLKKSGVSMRVLEKLIYN